MGRLTCVLQAGEGAGVRLMENEEGWLTLYLPEWADAWHLARLRQPQSGKVAVANSRPACRRLAAAKEGN